MAERVKPSYRRRPKGLSNTRLREVAVGAIDRVLEVRTAGNATVFSNEVLLLTSRGDFQEFLDSTYVHVSTDGDPFTAPLAEVLTWGYLTETGEIEPADKYQAAGEPLIAVSADALCVAVACRRSPTGTKAVVVDGTGLVNNLQALDEMLSTQPTAIVADQQDPEALGDLAARGCAVWRMTAKEILLGRDSPAAPVWMGNVVQAAANHDALTLDSVLANQPSLGKAARSLGGIARHTRSVGLEEQTRQPVGDLYRVLMEVGSWYRPPGETTRDRCASRVDAASAWIRTHSALIDAETANGVSEVASALHMIISDPAAGDQKLIELLMVLDASRAKGERCAVVARTPVDAQALAETVRAQGVTVPVIAATAIADTGFMDHVVVASWPGVRVFESVVAQAVAPRITLIAYPHEHEWFSGLQRRTELRRRERPLSADEKARVTGLTSLREVVTPVTVAPEREQYVDIDSMYDAATHLERIASGMRKGAPPLTSGPTEPRLAKYVGFIGQTYCHLTETHRVPVVSALMQVGSRVRRVPLARVEDLKVGDLLLFRDQGDKDIIALIAEEALGADLYAERRAAADRWRAPLRTLGQATPSTLGQDLHLAHQRLKRHGIDVHLQTVRGWLSDPARIGPGKKEDLTAIAEAAGDKDLADNIEDVWEAIREIRGSHVSAGSRLSELLLQELPQRLEHVRDEETEVDLTLGQAWLVQVEAIGSQYEHRSYTEVNRLLWA